MLELVYTVKDRETEEIVVHVEDIGSCRRVWMAFNNEKNVK